MNCSSVRNSPTPSAPVSLQHRQVGDEPRIVQQRDRDAVAGDRRLVLELEIVRAALGREPDLVDIGLLEIAASACRCTVPAGPSTMMSSPFSRHRDDVLGLPDRHHARASVATIATCAVDAALFEHDGAQPRAVVFEQLRRAHVARDENGVLGQLALRRRRAVAGEHAQQPVGEIVEIVQPVADVGIGRAQHAGARIVLHALDRRFGGEAVGDRFLSRSTQPRSLANIR